MRFVQRLLPIVFYFVFTLVGYCQGGSDTRLYLLEGNGEVSIIPPPFMTKTPTVTQTPSFTNTMTSIPTATITRTPSNTPTSTITETPSNTFTPTATNTPMPTFKSSIIKDPELDIFIRSTFDDPEKDVTDDDLSSITGLQPAFSNIQNIEGIQHCVNIKYLTLMYNRIEDINCISNLENLVILNLDHNLITDFSAVSGLSNLTKLQMRGMEIEDIRFLADLNNLTYLSLDENKIKDISPLSALPVIRRIELSDNLITDIETFVANTTFDGNEYIDLSGNPLSCTAVQIHIPQLISRGVEVVYDSLCIPSPKSNNQTPSGMEKNKQIVKKITPTDTPTAQPNALSTKAIQLRDGVTIDMVLIPSGSFLMGRYAGEQDSSDWENPQHEVTFDKCFYISRYEITKDQWYSVRRTRPWSGKPFVNEHPQSPAVYVSFDRIVGSFIGQLNRMGQGTFRLPTEAEWEYACRAGASARFYWGDDPQYKIIHSYAWYAGNAWGMNQNYAHIVGRKLPNSWGLYDMCGNVYEWCQDGFKNSYEAAPTDGGSVPGNWREIRVLRGGGWNSYPGFCRSAGRSRTWDVNSAPNIGFRLVREID